MHDIYYFKCKWTFSELTALCFLHSCLEGLSLISIVFKIFSITASVSYIGLLCLFPPYSGLGKCYWQLLSLKYTMKVAGEGCPHLIEEEMIAVRTVVEAVWKIEVQSQREFSVLS